MPYMETALNFYTMLCPCDIVTETAHFRVRMYEMARDFLDVSRISFWRTGFYLCYGISKVPPPLFLLQALLHVRHLFDNSPCKLLRKRCDHHIHAVADCVASVKSSMIRPSRHTLAVASALKHESITVDFRAEVFLISWQVASSDFCTERTIECLPEGPTDFSKTTTVFLSLRLGVRDEMVTLDKWTPKHEGNSL